MNLQTFLTSILKFLDETVIPVLIAIAFLVFLWHITRFFIFEGGDEKKHSDARRYALWSITAFVIIVSLWGIVKIFADTLNFGHNKAITPDYIGSKGKNIPAQIPGSGSSDSGYFEYDDQYTAVNGGGDYDINNLDGITNNNSHDTSDAFESADSYYDDQYNSVDSVSGASQYSTDDQYQSVNGAAQNYDMNDTSGITDDNSRSTEDLFNTADSSYDP